MGAVTELSSIARFDCHSIETAAEMPEYYARLVALLEKQPVFNGDSPSSVSSKVVAVSEYADVRLCDLFNQKARKTFGKEEGGLITECGLSRCGRHTVRGELIPQGVELLLESQAHYSIERLQKAFAKVYGKVTEGWSPTIGEEELADHDLFVKKKDSAEEDVMIRFMVKKLGLEESVECDLGLEDRSLVYLTVKRSAREEVTRKLGFKLP